MGTTTDRADPLLNEVDPTSGLQAVYLVLSDEERRRGFVRPVRTSYRHVGVRPTHETRPLSAEEHERYAAAAYIAYEPYPPSEDSSALGRYWTPARLRSGCGGVTTMGQAIAETYARDPTFYGGTYCATCHRHSPVEEFEWEPAPGETIDPDHRRLGS